MKTLKDLHTGRKKLSGVERIHFLQELEEELKVYYLSHIETVNKPYFEQKQGIIVRIIKTLVCQPQGTSKSQLFSRGDTRHKSEDPDDMEERGEWRREQTDEARLKHINLHLYNPLSKKYKAKREELLRNLKRGF